jgi:hypothetical protein
LLHFRQSVQALVSGIQKLLSSGLSRQTSLLEILDQSLIFRDQLWASSVFFATLYFKQPTHQLGEIFHQQAENWSQMNSFRGGSVPRGVGVAASAGRLPRAQLRDSRVPRKSRRSLDR